ncbi:MOSC domain-containing protein [Natrialbaceae archaeon GCM10025810]|uniref:MOSC domain-containing protein n=1 Tax=Halovalidus salilacus TaxID=3075124 RepID=UPI00360B4CCD
MPTLATIAVYPIKALDPVTRDRTSITDVGGLAGDRIYAMVAEDGTYVNGKLTADVHQLRAETDLDANRIRLRVRGEDAVHEFHFDHDREALEEWLSDYFAEPIELEAAPGGSLTDSVVYSNDAKAGPTLISAATIREVASWYDGVSPEEMRLRLRPNLVVDCVPPFWEERLVAPAARRIQIGDVVLEGRTLVPRCVVPARNPYTGEKDDGFREIFLEKREETVPDWTDRDAFDGNLFKLMVLTRVPKTDRGRALHVGDAVQVSEFNAEREYGASRDRA